jgi:hypothetical protein
MAIRITEVEMVTSVDEKIVAAVGFSKHAAADGNCAWIPRSQIPLQGDTARLCS